MTLKILAFGDSITSGFHDPEGGWATRLFKSFLEVNLAEDETNEVFNLGISGERTAGLLKRITSETQHRAIYDVRYRIIIATGINDAYEYMSGEAPAVSDEEFQERYSAILAEAKKLVPQVYALNLTPVDEAQLWPMRWDHSRGLSNRRISTFNQYIATMTAAAGVTLVDVASEFKSKPELLADGLHPNGAGHEAICQLVRNALQD